jgi:plastocyanin
MMAMMRAPSSHALLSLLLLAMIVGMHGSPRLLSAQVDPGEDVLPPIVIDALSGFRWSNDDFLAAPGQRLVITNRDVQRHSFTIDEWDIDQSLPTLVPFEILIPEEAEIGSSVTFYSAVADDREQGLEGVIHIVSEDELLADTDRSLTVATTIQNRLQIEIGDDFAFTPSSLDVEPGAFIEVRNIGLVEHHFVVDEWSVNETIPSSDVALVQVPEDARVGNVFTFYCSVPGHEAQGMSGTLTIVSGRMTVETISPDRESGVTVGKDLRPFIPEAVFLGEEWSKVRSGDAETLVPQDDALSLEIFPYEGLGAVYVGPQGSRVTLVVLPLTDRVLPANQIRDAMSSVQDSMMQAWTKDRITSAGYIDADPPTGCDAAQRVSGIVPVLTIPAGATACQLRSAGVAIFVTVEGAIGDLTGVAAADEVIARLLTQSPQAIIAGEARRG